MTLSPPLRLPNRASNAHKGTFGRVLLIGGSRGMSGSIAMSAIAALHSGSGLVSAAVPDRCLETVAAFHPSMMTIPLADDGSGKFALEASQQIAEWVPTCDAIGAGPGMTTAAGTIRIVDRLLTADQVPRVIDADAINTLTECQWRDRIAGPVVLTPHPGEFARLTGIPGADRPAQIDAARKLADELDLVIVLKGGPSEVISPGESWTNDTGNPGMATAGSGDVLTGVITSLLGQGLSARDAARLAVWVHGLAGDYAADEMGQQGLTSMELLAKLPAAFAAISA